MKTKIILLLLATVLLSSCGTGAIHRYSSNRITIEKKDSTSHEYALLSLRGDTALVVVEPENSVYEEQISYSHAIVIKKNSIRKIIGKGRGGYAREFLGSFGGSGIGLLFALAQNTPGGFEPDGWFSGSPNGRRIAGGILLGCIVGGIAGSLLPAPVDIDPMKPEEIQYLRSISLYPNHEPEMMQYVK